MENNNGKAPTEFKDNEGNKYKSKAEADAANTQITRVRDLQRQATEQQTLQKLNQYKGPGYEALPQNQFEKQAGVTPPGYRGMTDVQTGALLDQYKVNPFASPEAQKLRERANATGPSDLAQAQLQRQKYEESNQMGKVGLQAQQAQSQAQSQLMRQGGLGGGARTSLARSGMRDQLMAQQGVGSQGVMSRYGINEADLQNKQNLMGQVADVARQGDLSNIQSMQSELKNRATFDANRYNQQMQAWGAKQSADATRAAGGGGGGKK